VAGGDGAPSLQRSPNGASALGRPVLRRSRRRHCLYRVARPHCTTAIGYRSVDRATWTSPGSVRRADDLVLRWPHALARVQRRRFSSSSARPLPGHRAELPPDAVAGQPSGHDGSAGGGAAEATTRSSSARTRRSQRAQSAGGTDRLRSVVDGADRRAAAPTPGASLSATTLTCSPERAGVRGAARDGRAGVWFSTPPAPCAVEQCDSSCAGEPRRSCCRARARRGLGGGRRADVSSGRPAIIARERRHTRSAGNTGPGGRRRLLQDARPCRLHGEAGLVRLEPETSPRRVLTSTDCPRAAVGGFRRDHCHLTSAAGRRDTASGWHYVYAQARAAVTARESSASYRQSADPRGPRTR
jgi:hypothetical protein